MRNASNSNSSFNHKMHTPNSTPTTPPAMLVFNWTMEAWFILICPVLSVLTRAALSQSPITRSGRSPDGWYTAVLTKVPSDSTNFLASHARSCPIVMVRTPCLSSSAIPVLAVRDCLSRICAPNDARLDFHPAPTRTAVTISIRHLFVEGASHWVIGRKVTSRANMLRADKSIYLLPAAIVLSYRTSSPTGSCSSQHPI